jgi:glyoxylase-like metal-dependent hydrolase (beta-lactamase superfamily II)
MAAMAEQVKVFETSYGAQIYQLPLLAFPGLPGYAYLVLLEEEGQRSWVLIDTGSGFGESNRHLDQGFQAVSQLSGYPVKYSDLAYILITHGHIDHIGGLPYVLESSHAKVGVHELDRRILTNYEERLTVVARRMAEFLVEAGVPEDRRPYLLDLYKMTKSLFRSVKVDFTYEAQGMRVGPFEVLHVPGHCAGHVVIRLHDILFSGDHILQGTSPHQSPEHLTLSTGLDHYLKSLDSLLSWAGSESLTLAGHKDPLLDLPARIVEIQQVHKERLQKVLEILKEPHTIVDVSLKLFGEAPGYNELLALTEAGAHVEYLYQRGILEIANLEEYEKQIQAVPVLYRCVECSLQEGQSSMNNQAAGPASLQEAGAGTVSDM